MNHKLNNLKILAILTRIIEKYPYLRFQQILSITNLYEPNIDKFYEESSVTLKKLEDETNRLFKTLGYS